MLMSRIEFRRPAKETRAAYLRVGIVTSCRYGGRFGKTARQGELHGLRDFIVDHFNRNIDRDSLENKNNSAPIHAHFVIAAQAHAA